MARIKYYYDTEKCKYERITPKLSNIFLNLFGFLFITFIVAVGLVYAYDKFYDLPEESALKDKVAEQELKIQIIEDFTTGIDTELEILKDRDKNVYRIYVGTDSIPYVDEESTYASIANYDKILSGESDLLKEAITRQLEKIAALKIGIKKQNASRFFLQHLKGFEEKRKQALPWITPIGRNQKYRVASGYGYRIHPVLKIKKMHTGLDFACAKGTPIRATGSGKIKRIKRSCCKGYGNMVDINHGYGFVTRYAHMSKINVKKGQKVKRGHVIGEVGTTGTSTGNHLHYEVIKNRKNVNPILFVHDLSPDEYEEMLIIASQENEALSIPTED